MTYGSTGLGPDVASIIPLGHVIFVYMPHWRLNDALIEAKTSHRLSCLAEEWWLVINWPPSMVQWYLFEVAVKILMAKNNLPYLKEPSRTTNEAKRKSLSMKCYDQHSMRTQWTLDSNCQRRKTIVLQLSLDLNIIFISWPEQISNWLRRMGRKRLGIWAVIGTEFDWQSDEIKDAGANKIRRSIYIVQYSITCRANGLLRDRHSSVIWCINSRRVIYLFKSIVAPTKKLHQTQWCLRLARLYVHGRIYINAS